MCIRDRAFTDGKTVVPMVSSMDHKRAHDHDEGLNTGGMGTVAPNPCYTEDIARVCMDTIFLPTLAAMRAESCPFKGCLYFGLMLTPDGPKVIEYNCRFGDPETQVVLPLRLLIPVAVFCFPNYVLGYPTMGAMGLAKFANISVVFGTFVYLAGVAVLWLTVGINLVSLCLLTSLTEGSILALSLIHI